MRALIAMSGGVDSTASALLTKRMGYTCTGVTMNLCGSGAEDEAARAAASLGISHEVLDFTEEFRRCVVEPFACAYEDGVTPNPCVCCNTRIKFGLLYEYAAGAGYDLLVTGHYAKIVSADSGLRLARAADRSKDQSYFLYGIGHEKLGRLLFPLGDFTKREARAIAAEAGMASAYKAESQDICFVSGGSYTDFLESYRGAPFEGGNFVDTAGNVLGRHSGTQRFTIGQRKGLGGAHGRRMFVKEIRPVSREVVLSEESGLFVSRIEISDFNCMSKEGGFAGRSRVQIMIRYGAKPVWATVSAGEAGRVLAEFDEPVRAPARGQSAVLYDGDFVMGGGMIA